MTQNRTHIEQVATIVISVSVHTEPGAYLYGYDNTEAHRTGVRSRFDGLAAVLNKQS